MISPVSRPVHAAVSLTACMLVMAHGSIAFADTTLLFTRQNSNEPAVVEYLTATRLRIDTFGDGKHSARLLYIATSDTLTMLQDGSREYVVLDPRARHNIELKFKQIIEETQKSAMTRWMLKKALGDRWALLTAKPKIKDEKRILKVGNYECHEYHVSIGRVVNTDLCTTKPSELGLSAATFNVLRNLSKALQQLTGSMQKDPAYTLLDKGISIRTIDKNSNQGRILKKVGHKPLSAALFKIPPGYKRKDIVVAN